MTPDDHRYDEQDDERDDARAERLLDTLDRSPVRLPRSVRTVVMARVRAEPASPWMRAWRWLGTPRLSPLAAGLVLAVVVGVLLARRSVTPSQPAPAAQAAARTVPVRLVFLAPQAASVAVTGDFARWDPQGVPLTQARGDGGVWSVDLELAPGLHHYVFIVNGTEWRPDPNAASQVDDGFGQKNSVLLVPAPRSS